MRHKRREFGEPWRLRGAIARGSKPADAGTDYVSGDDRGSQFAERHNILRRAVQAFERDEDEVDHHGDGERFVDAPYGVGDRGRVVLEY